MNKAVRMAELISDAKNIAVLSGAGVSVNAGIADFRGPKGIYTTGKYDPEAVFDIARFIKKPLPFYDFARDFINGIKNVKPTFTHYFLASLEKTGKLKGIITQNIDALHQKAGSSNVFEFHGSFWNSYCMACGAHFPYKEMEEKIFKEEVPLCVCGAVIKPDIVFFGEPVKCLNESVKLAFESDLFIIIGSSLTVYPAAAIPDSARGKIAVVNKGSVNLPRKRVELFADEDMDEFFEKTASILNMDVKCGG